MSDNFQINVIKRLDEISERLSSIEKKVDEATSFADSIIGDDGVMPGNGLDAIKSTFSNLLNPSGLQADQGGDMGEQSLGDLVSSLRTFQDRLASVKDAMSDLPTKDDENK